MKSKTHDCKKRTNTRCHLFGIALIFTTLYVCSFCITLATTRRSERAHHVDKYFVPERQRRRRRTPEEDAVPVIISSFARNQSTFATPFYSPEGYLSSNATYDYGGLNFTRANGEREIINPDAKVKITHPAFRAKNDNFNFDDDYTFSRINKDHTTCKHVSWHHLYTPTCLKFHEIDVLQYRMVNHGYYRDAWFAMSEYGGEYIALKTLRKRHKFKSSTYESIRLDALVMERLASSPRIVDMYAHCGTSIITERFAEEIQELIVPGHGWMKQSELNDNDDVKPQNNYTAKEKLTIALEMAESIADLHGFKDGLIVHDDIQPCQWLRTKDGKMKLNDFNRAEVMLWDEKEEKYCKYTNGGGYGQYRSPEEFDNGLLNEKIDIYSLGNNFYALLTGLWNFYENEDDQVVQEKIIGNEIPFIDERYRSRSIEEKALVNVMQYCWKYNPKKRPTIFEVIRMLRYAQRESEKLAMEEKNRHDMGTM